VYRQQIKKIISVIAINNTTQQKINFKKTQQLVEKFLHIYSKTDWEVSIAIVGDQKMKRLNKLYRRLDKTTDVLSFRGGEFLGRYLGEIIININYLQHPRRYQEIFSRQPSREYLFYFILIHGLLHLIGYEDDSELERKNMLDLGRNFLKKYCRS